MQIYLLLGLLLFAAGTLLGIPFGLSKRRGHADVTELWRVAHLSTCLGGISLIALVFALERLFPGREYLVMLPFTIGAYLFFVACTLSGVIGKGWHHDRTMLSVRIIYWMQMAASGASVIAIFFLIMLAVRLSYQ